MIIILLCGSLRKESLNKKLLTVTKNILENKEDIEINFIDHKSLEIPVYDGDVEASGMPLGVQKLGEQIKNASAIIIASPEYNGSISGTFKNTVDWVSRLRPIPWENKPVLLMGASPGGFGAIRALGFMRTPFEALNAYVYPQVFALPKAHEAFNSENEFNDEGLKKRLETLIDGYLKYAKKFS